MFRMLHKVDTGKEYETLEITPMNQSMIPYFPTNMDPTETPPEKFGSNLQW